MNYVVTSARNVIVEASERIVKGFSSLDFSTKLPLCITIPTLWLSRETLERQRENVVLKNIDGIFVQTEDYGFCPPSLT